MLGFETNDDAAVYRLNDQQAALQTVDFFTPIVDDPYDFGRIAAANALSDIWAMGGRPVTAMNLLAASCSLPAGVVADIIRGGAEKCAEAGCAVVGGHTIDDSEPKFGLAIMGLVAPDEVLYNRGAEPGDVLVLTKSLGTGLWGTALKRGVAEDTEPDARVAIESMAALNKLAGEEAQALRVEDENVHACTDVTGFGIAGHLHEMAVASGCAAELQLNALPLLPRVWQLAGDDVTPGKTADLIAWTAEFGSFGDKYSSADKTIWNRIICDPQTSGGLMLALPESAAQRYSAVLAQAGEQVWIIGRFVEGEAGQLHFR